jgi:hypothetical protein
VPRSAVFIRDSGPSAVSFSDGPLPPGFRRFGRTGMTPGETIGQGHHVCRTGTSGAPFGHQKRVASRNLSRFPRVAGGRPFSADPDDEALRLLFTTSAGPASSARLPMYP